MAIEFGISPLVYVVIISVMTAILGGFLFISLQARNFPEKLFLGLTSIYVILGRLPVVLFNRELNVDESQMLAQGLTLAHDPVYWRSVDGTTGGPLSSYYLTLIGSIRGVFDYTTGHLAALTLVLFTLFFSYKALKNWFGAQHAAIATFPAILFYSFTKEADFVHYTSEHFPIAVLAICMYIFSLKKFHAPKVLIPAFALGFLLTTIPLGKIQSVPIAGIIGLYATCILVYQKSWDKLIALFAGCLAFLVLFVGVLYTNDVFDDFITFYIQGNFQYSGDGSLLKNFILMFSQYLFAEDFLILLLPFLFLVTNKKRSNKYLQAYPYFGVFAGALVISAVLAIARTGSGYGHYLLLMIVPLITLMGYLMTSSNIIFRRSIIIPIVILFGIQGYHLIYKRPFNDYPSSATLNRELPFTETAKSATPYLKNGESLVVWGWNCQYYVECQAPQGVAENHSIRSVFEHPMRDEYQTRYISNLQKTRPAVFIDATGPNSLWLQDTVTQSYHSFPLLKEFIDTNYQLIGNPEGNRLLIRKDLL